MSDPRMKTIWFFVGLMLLLMAALTFLAGIYQIFVPPATHTILAESHPNVWWGGLMMAFGAIMYLVDRKQTP